MVPGGAKMESPGMRNSLRFLVKPDFKGKVNLRTIVVDVLMEFLDLRVRDIVCLQDFPKQRIYDITFSSSEMCWNIYEKIRNTDNDLLRKMDVIPLFMQE